ncbi:MAG TPA: carboxymuconolactone decarboxylase family protein [Burkholderiales bacterium]|nr:carboxymuconolactone decarboxylase family protein [Burkholderiales bacterium]
MTDADRMPPLDSATMTPAQREAAQALAAGPRGGVKGPFIPLLRSPQLMDRLQKVGEYLRFHSSLQPWISEFVVLVVSRQWTQQFEWFVHVTLALDAGVKPETIASLAESRRPHTMAADEEIAYDFCTELLRTKGVSELTYRRAVQEFGEQGVVDMLGLLGYFTTVSMVMNVAHTPPPRDDRVSPLASLPA